MITWLIILVAALILLLLYKFFRKTLKIVFTITIVIGLLLLVLGIFVLKDANDFRDNFGTSKNIFVLSDGEKYITAVVLDFSQLDDEIVPFENLEILESGEVPEGYYKVFVITKQSLEDVEVDYVDVGYADLAKDGVITALFAEDPIYGMVDILEDYYGIEFTEEQIEATFEDPEEVRRSIFIATLVNVFGTSPMNLIEGVKNGNIIIYPETLMFKTIKRIPVSVFEQVDKMSED